MTLKFDSFNDTFTQKIAVMKKICTLAVLLSAYPCFAQQYIDNYLSGTPTYTTIANFSNSVNQPRDLDFKPNTHELWVANKGTSNGSTMLIIYDAGAPSQSMDLRMDSHSGHFMVFPTAFTFGDNGNWANTNEIKNTASPSSTFMGPALWTGDTSIFAKVFQNNWVGSKPLGSHLDMLHQSPFAMGIAHDSANAYWVVDGFNGNLCLYDFQSDHSPGYDDHSNGKIWRYSDVTLTRLPDVPSHMVLDKTTGWLYIVDAGTKRLIRVNTNSGTVAGTLTVPGTAPEALQGFWEVTGATVEVINTWGVGEQPSGVDIYDDRLIVGDFMNGDIYIYDISGSNPVSAGTIATGQAGMTGLKIGTDGKIWFTNYTANTVVRIDPSTTPDNDAGIFKIVAPVINTFPGAFYNAGANVCGTNVTPIVELKNTGANTLTSVTINYMIDGTPYNYLWNGSLAAGSSTNVTLPQVNTSAGIHVLTAYTTAPNTSTDSNPANDRAVGAFRTLSQVGTLPFTEDFTNTMFPPAGWTYIGHNFNNPMSHDATVGGFGTGLGSVKMDNYTGSTDIAGQRDILMLPRMDFSSATASVAMGFDMAYSQYDFSSDDSLSVLTSTDCGETWNVILQMNGPLMSTTTGPTSAAFAPNAAEWDHEVVFLGALAGQPDVMIAFRTASGFGNNVYIDNVNISNNLGVAETQSTKLNIYPNPTAGMLNIEVNAMGDATVSVRDITGRIVKTQTVTLTGNKAQVDITEQVSGTYFIDIKCNGQLYKEKVTLIK
jgi:hypothetical protein